VAQQSAKFVVEAAFRSIAFVAELFSRGAEFILIRERRETGAAVPIVSVRSVQILALSVAIIILGGCSVGLNNRVTENDPPIWGRVDCQRGEGNPEIQKQFEAAKATCLARGESADAVAGNAGGSPCMTEQGYVLRTTAEHEAACQAVEQQIGKPATQTKKPKRISTLAKPVPIPEPVEPAGPAKQ
jgi:hypothetical protein